MQLYQAPTSTVQCDASRIQYNDQSPNLEGRGIGPFCGPPQEGYNVDIGCATRQTHCMHLKPPGFIHIA